MSGIWGWVSPQIAAQNAAETLQHMGGTESPSALFSGYTQAALGGHGGFAALQSSENDGICAVVFGQAQWSESRFEQIARQKGNAAAAIAAYQERGPAFLELVHGPFSLALLWPREGKALLAIDRIGIRSLSYSAVDQTLIFGSSCDHVVAHPAMQRRIDVQGVFDYLFSHIVSAPKTIYQDVEKLLPGQYLLWDQGRLEKRFYWHMPYDDHAQRPQGELKEAFLSLLQDSVQTAADANPKSACFLSGGTDSSTVAGMFRRVRNQAVPTYSIGFNAEGFDETEYARIASNHFGTDAHEYYVTPEHVVEGIPLIARTYDEPFGNASAIPTYFCAKRAHDDGYAAMLAGDGGDELFGGNFRYGKQLRFETYAGLPQSLRKGLIEPLLFHMPSALSPIRKLRRYVEQANIPLPDRLESYNFLYQAQLAEVFEPEFLRQIDPQQPIEMLREVYARTASGSPINRMMHLDLKRTLADNDLRKVNRMCELAGMQVNYPLLDERLAEFSARLAPDMKVRGSQLRYFFKEALRDFLPAEIISKKKHGFGLPFGLWLASHPPLRQMAVDSLHRLRQRGYIKPAYIDFVLAQHGGAHASYYGVMVWVLMMLEEWLTEHKL